jgi:sulfite reductase alpha subunit-like flavoprotein
MGKMIDKRLSELGGKRSLPLCCADEATGLEETVEGWKIEVMALLKKCDELIAASAVMATKAIETDTVVVEDGTTTADIFESVITEVSTIAPERGIPIGLSNLSMVSEFLRLKDHISSSPESTLLPNSKKVVSNGPDVKIDTRNDKELSLIKETMPIDGWTAEIPFPASVIACRWLTALDNVIENDYCWGQQKRVLHLELNLAESGMDYLPGDSIGICCPNPSYLVDAVFQRLKEAHPDCPLSLDSLMTITTCGKDEKSSLKEILEYK